MQRAVIAFALLAGTDLTPGMPGIGVERAETFLKYCQQQRTVRLGRGHEAGEDALDTLHKHRSGGGGDTGGVVGSAETKRVVAAVARHCAYFHSPRGRRAGARISRHPDAAPQLELARAKPRGHALRERRDLRIRPAQAHELGVAGAQSSARRSGRKVRLSTRAPEPRSKRLYYVAAVRRAAHPEPHACERAPPPRPRRPSHPGGVSESETSYGLPPDSKV